MRIFLLTAVTMVAFAANSVLNRMALDGAAIGPAAFAAVRLVSGAAMLAALVLWRGRARFAFRPVGAGALVVYMLGFSFAYVSLDAGLGALILFGGVQVTMFAGAVLAREAIPVARWLGAGVALAGLGWLLAPGSAAPEFWAAGLMLAAAGGWGVYSLLGRGAADPLGETAANFLWAAPVALVLWALVADGVSWGGVVLAVLSGAVTSGMGYALWYRILPKLGASRAAVAQLTVPVIAAAGGVLLLGEVVGPRLLFGGALVLGGVLLSLSAGSVRAARR